MPRDEIHDPALAEVTERNLRPHFPPGADEHLTDRLRHCAVTPGEESIEARAAPARFQDEANLEDLTDLAQRADATTADVSSLDP